MAINQNISAFPTAPNSTTDTPTEFNAKADAYVNHQSNVFTGEVNQWAAEANALAVSIEDIVATLPEGLIDDDAPSSVNTYSSNKIEEIISEGGIEYGSNDNGYYTKFPDGTLICRDKTSGTGTGETNWTFPHAFVSTADLIITGAAQTSSAFLLSVVFKIPTTASVNFSTYDSSNTRVANGVGLMAVGRWRN